MTPPTRAAVASVAEYVRTWLPFRLRLTRTPGVQAAIWFDDALVFSAAFGAADLASGEPLRTDHLFRIASHSKTFTATAVLRLFEQGRLRLDDPLGAHLDFLAESAIAGVTLRELLSHSAGVCRDGDHADHWQLSYPFPDAGQLREVAAAEAFVTDANVAFKYSNTAFGLLGLVVEAVSGQPYNDHVRAEIVERLGLEHTGPEYDPALASAYACGYSALSYAEARVPITHVDTAALAAATGFYSTAEDICRYAAAHFVGDERLLGASVQRQMQHPVRTVPHQDGTAYGLGLEVRTVGERTMVGHGGGYPGHITRTLWDPVDRLAVAVFTNAIDGPAGELIEAMIKLVDLAASFPVAEPVDHAGFVGRYANLWGVVDIASIGGRLLGLNPCGANPADAYTTLVVEGADRLRVSDGPGFGAVGETVEFTRAADGSVVSIHGLGGVTFWPIEDYRVPAGGVTPG